MPSYTPPKITPTDPGIERMQYLARVLVLLRAIVAARQTAQNRIPATR